MKILTLNDKTVRQLRANHPILKGKKLLASGQFSGVFECSETTVLKLSIDEQSYNFLKALDESNQKHFPKLMTDYGEVGRFVTSRNIKVTAISKPIQYDVPLYLYEVEKLQKIPASTENRKIITRISKDWRALDNGLFCESRQERALKIANALRENVELLKFNPTIMNAVDTLAAFVHQNEGAFADLHGMNFMQRDDGTLVFSDPIGDLRIYKGHYALRSPMKEQQTA
jgi:hypothetical protein